jgi:Arc/MetJ-type ribon-helix-helix transcriptional regulator
MEKRKSFRYEDGFQQKLDDLVAHGFANETEVIRAAVMKMHRDTFVNSHETVNLTTVENKGGRNVKSDSEKDKDKRKNICTQHLYGEVEDDECVFYNYFKHERHKQERPINSLSEKTVERQFDPSKEEVARLQDEGKAQYSLEDDPFYNARQD